MKVLRLTMVLAGLLCLAACKRAVVATKQVESADLPFNGTVCAVSLQPDGKIVVGGHFTKPRKFIARLNADGSLDGSFNASADHTVFAIAMLPDGKILASGNFTKLNEAEQRGIGRLLSDGTPDGSFQAQADNDLDSEVAHALVRQPDGKILIGGNFSSVNSTARGRIARLSADGALDTGFNATFADVFRLGGVNFRLGVVYDLALQPEGKIIVGGAFSPSSGANHSNIVRLEPDGTVDTTFNAQTGNAVETLAIQSDGKIIIGGKFFNQVNGTERTGLARLNVDGTLDVDFKPTTNGFDNFIVVLQSDGKILLGGNFTKVNGVTCSSLVRLNPDGTLDSSFSVTGDRAVYSAALQPDGRIVIGGDFAQINGEPHAFVARLNRDGTIDPTFKNAEAVRR